MNPDSTPHANPQTITPDPAELGDRYGVLFVDDEESTCKAFARAISKHLPVFTRTNGMDAWRCMNEHAEHIAVVVTDQRMPGMQGNELLRMIRAEHPRTIRILTTAYADLGDAIDAVNAGAIYAYITKPWDLQDLRLNIQRAYELFMLQRERELLIAEKQAAYQRLVLVDRLRQLALLGAALHCRLPAAAKALQAYWTLAAGINPQPVGPHADLWELTLLESRQLIETTDRLVGAINAALEAGEASYPLASLVTGSSEALCGRATLLATGLAELGQRASGAIQLGGDQQTLHLAFPVPAVEINSLLAPGHLAKQAGLLLAWIAVYDQGGGIAYDHSQQQLNVVLPRTRQAPDGKVGIDWFMRHLDRLDP